ncbi:MAG: hypothetical protein V1738_03600 [Patescibacteria group bacterium]
MKRTKKYLHQTSVLAIMLAVFFSAVPTSVVEAAFNPNYIMSDAEMRDAYAMSFQDIYIFLSEKGGLNNQFDVDAEDGLLKGTAQLIDDAAKRYSINPKYVLVLMQKESGIIETQIPNENQLNWSVGYALCDGCYKSSELAQKYKGFGRQIDAGAGWMDWYMSNAPSLTYLKQPGITYTISSEEVTPINLATAGMYNYTPHLHGNKLFYNIWQRWWGRGVGEIRFPDGTLIMNESNGAHAVIQGGKFRPIASASVLESRFGNRAPVILTDGEFRVLEQANPGKPLSFTDLSLVRDETGMAYLLIGNERHAIESSEVFREIGFNPEEIEDVLLQDIEDYTLGAAITLDGAYPLGQLVQDTATGGVWYVESGVRHAIWDRSILDTRFGQRTIVQTTAEEINGYELGDPVTFVDGTLAKSPDDPAVYVISDGQRRRIPSEEVFLGYGYTWTSIVTCNDKALALHPLGEPLLLFEETVEAAAIEN